MKQMRTWMAAFGALLAAGGCTGSGSEITVAAYQSRTIETANAEEVLDAAMPILQREFGRVTLDRRRRTAVSAPLEYQGAGDSGTARDLLGAQSTLRRVATFNAEPRGDGTVARLRIDVQRRDTVPRTSLEPAGNSSRLSDSAALTPVERDAATTNEQNMVWTTVRRDRPLERTLLEELVEQFTPAAAEETPPATRPQPADENG